jgi:excisionase family DNA binding protein
MADTEDRRQGEELLTPAEAPRVLTCGRTLLYRLLAQGSIKSLRIGTLRRIRRSDLDRFIVAQTNDSQAQDAQRRRSESSRLPL